MAYATIPGPVQASLDTPEAFVHFYRNADHGVPATALCGVVALEFDDNTPGDTTAAPAPKCAICAALAPILRR